jgi:vacuolar-type H+-ATPase subunit H
MVLAAEESGRRLVAEARERASGVRTAADANARDVLVRGAETARAKAAEDRERVLGAARDEAGALTAESDAVRDAAISAARGRLATVAETVAQALKG